MKKLIYDKKNFTSYFIDVPLTFYPVKIDGNKIIKKFGIKIHSKCENSLYKQFVCIGCLKNTFKSHKKDYFSLDDKIWNKINPKNKGMLCWKCCEKRLGRNLLIEDLKNCYLNIKENYNTRKLFFKKFGILTMEEMLDLTD